MTRQELDDLLAHVTDLKQRQDEFIRDLNGMVSHKNKNTMRKFDTTKKKFVTAATALRCQPIIDLLEKAKETCDDTRA
jgi:hypothetical protein